MLLCMAGLCSLSGCHLVDFPDFMNHPDKYAKLCPIKRITYYTDYNWDTIVTDFRYNKFGNPVHIRFDNTATGRPAFAFLYDKKQRITDYLGVYGDVAMTDGTPEKLTGFTYHFWHRYVYENNRVVRDTMRGMDSYPHETPQYTWIITYRYDARDLVIQKDWINDYIHITQKQLYTYDARGNLLREQFYSNGVLGYETNYSNYTDKPNIRATNKVWMFIDDNYSVNAPAVAVRYNRYGLPLIYQLSSEQGIGFLYQWDLGQSDIEYDCK